MMQKNKALMTAGLAAMVLFSGSAFAMTQKGFVALCRTGSDAEVSLALQDKKLSASRGVKSVTPLMQAAASKGEAASVDKIRRLIAAGARVEVKDNEGMTPLMYAARFSDSPEVIRALIAAGARTGSRDSSGRTALALAAASNPCAKVLNALIDAGADVDRAAYGRVTPLMNALSAGMKENALVLLAAGADPDAKDRWGRTAADYLKRSRSLRGDVELAGLLKGPAAIAPLAPARMAELCRFGAPSRLAAVLKAGAASAETVDGLTPPGRP